MRERIKLIIPIGLLCALCLLGGCTKSAEATQTEPMTQIPTIESVPIITEPTATEPTVTEPEPEPEFSMTPQAGTKRLYVNGTALSDSYLSDGTVYLCLDALNEALPVAYSTEIVIGANHSCTADIQGHTLEFCADTASMLEDHVVNRLDGKAIFDGTAWYLPAESLMRFFGFSVLDDPEADAVYFTQFPHNEEIAAGRDVPVLMYHAVSDNCWGISELFVSPSTLDEQIALLLENGYTPITFEDFDRLDEIEKPVMLTFDDGYDDNYTELYPILQKYQVKATIFMITNDIGKNHKLTAEQITEMSESGLVSIQSHTMSHEYLSSMNEERLQTELTQSKLVLARLTGKESFVLCYPTGMYSDLSLQVTREHYEFGLLMSSGLYTTGGDPYMIRRYYVPRGLSASSLLYRLP